ncbi:MAG TPA: acyltransferase [Xanthomonadales bacterium]|nr:acyltransferase [Xanthomonadales bacterium]
MKLNIQMLRAFAALAVVLYHLGPHYRDAGGAFTLLIGISQWGFFGVDVFFVISGFVISYTVFPKERNLQGAGTFLRHRLSRIYLGYWPFALLALYVLPLHGPANLAQVSTFSTLALTSADLGKLALPVAWSLSYELYFYALFGLLFCCSNEVIKRVFLVIFVLLLARVLFVPVDPDSQLYFWVSAYMLEFLYGVLIFLFQGLLLKRRLIPPACILVVAGLMLGSGNHLQHDARVLYFGISAAALVVLALQLEESGLFSAPHWLVSLGDSSYALYLSHLFVITAFYQWGWRDNLAAQSPVVVELGFLALVLYMVFLAHFWYRRVERPLYLLAIGRKRMIQPATTPAGE